MVQHRPTSEAARRAVLHRRCRDAGAQRTLGTPPDARCPSAPGFQSKTGGMSGVRQGEDEEACPRSAPPASASIVPPRPFIGTRGYAGCPLCARRSRRGSMTVGFARTSRHFLAATWVVLMLGEPLPSAV